MTDPLNFLALTVLSLTGVIGVLIAEQNLAAVAILGAYFLYIISSM